MENRRQRRVRLDLPVHIVLAEPSPLKLRESSGILYDLSTGGCAFRLAQEIPIGTRVQLRIELNPQLVKKFKKPQLTANGAVCRIERHASEYLLSVRFFR